MRTATLANPLSRLLAVPAAVLVLAACQDKELTNPTDSAVAVPTPASAEAVRPWEGSYVSTAPGVLIAPGAAGAEERCTAQGLFTLRTVLEGRATHVGHFTAETSNCTAFPIPGPVDIVDGRIVITAANGDQIFSSYSGRQDVVDPATGAARFEVENVITGGTGRFADAAGWDDNSGSINFQTGLLAGQFEGRISY